MFTCKTIVCLFVCLIVRITSSTELSIFDLYSIYIKNLKNKMSGVQVKCDLFKDVKYYVTGTINPEVKILIE